MNQLEKNIEIKHEHIQISIPIHCEAIEFKGCFKIVKEGKIN